MLATSRPGGPAVQQEPSTPRVTVTIPVFDGCPYLLETIESLRRQTFRDFEVIFGNDCSTDESLRILEAAAADDDRFTVFSTPRNLGSAARVLSHIVERARGSFLIYASQDDLFSNDWLERAVARQEETGADAVVSDVELYDPARPGLPERLSGLNGDHKAIIPGRAAFEQSLCWRIGGNALWRSTIVKAIGYPEVGFWSDEYAVRLFYLACDRVAFADGTFYYRQNNPKAVTKEVSARSFEVLRVDLLIFRLFCENGLPPTQCASSLDVAIQRCRNLASLAMTGDLDRPERVAAKGHITAFLAEFAGHDVRARKADYLGLFGIRGRIRWAIVSHGYGVLWLSCLLRRAWGSAFGRDFRRTGRVNVPHLPAAIATGGDLEVQAVPL
jgi:glycosyltransferase involved in cell wall biosynthesis